MQAGFKDNFRRHELRVLDAGPNDVRFYIRRTAANPNTFWCPNHRKKGSNPDGCKVSVKVPAYLINVVEEVEGSQPGRHPSFQNFKGHHKAGCRQKAEYEMRAAKRWFKMERIARRVGLEQFRTGSGNFVAALRDSGEDWTTGPKLKLVECKLGKLVQYVAKWGS